MILDRYAAAGIEGKIAKIDLLVTYSLSCTAFFWRGGGKGSQQKLSQSSWGLQAWPLLSSILKACKS